MNNSYSSYNNINDGFDMDPDDELYNMARNIANSDSCNNISKNNNNKAHKKPILNRSRNNFLFDNDELADIDTNYIQRPRFNPKSSYPDNPNNIGIVGQDYYSAWGDFSEINNIDDDVCSDNNLAILLKKYQESKSNTSDFNHIKKCFKCQKKLAKIIENNKKNHLFDSDSDSGSESYDLSYLNSDSDFLNTEKTKAKYNLKDLKNKTEKYKLQNQMLQNQILQQHMQQKQSEVAPILSQPIKVQENQIHHTNIIDNTDKSNKIVITKDLLFVIIVGIIIILMLDILSDKTRY